jgi:hypothetical protein
LAATSLGGVGYLTETDSGVLTAVKPITTKYLESVSYLRPDGSLNCAAYTKMKCTCIVSDNEPSGTTKIDEAGLYFVSGSTAKLFSHICFAPKWKEKESTLTIEWYILF